MTLHVEWEASVLHRGVWVDLDGACRVEDDLEPAELTAYVQAYAQRWVDEQENIGPMDNFYIAELFEVDGFDIEL